MPTALQQISQRRLIITVPANTTADFDSIPFSDFSATKYLIEFSNPTNSNFQALELFATKISSAVDDQLYSKFENGLDVTVKSLLVGADVVLRVTNNEAVEVTGSIAKIKL